MFRNNNYIFFNFTSSFLNFYCKNIYIINFQGKKKKKNKTRSPGRFTYFPKWHPEWGIRRNSGMTH